MTFSFYIHFDINNEDLSRLLEKNKCEDIPSFVAKMTAYLQEDSTIKDLTIHCRTTTPVDMVNTDEQS